MEKEAVGEPDVPMRKGPARQRPPATPKRPRVSQGAGGQCPSQIDDDESDGIESPVENWAKVTGPLPKAGKKAAVRLGKTARVGAAQIARSYGKSIRSIMIEAGLDIRHSRTGNIANSFKQWYAHMHPAKPGRMFLSFDSGFSLIFVEQWVSMRTQQKSRQPIMPFSTASKAPTLRLRGLHSNL